ncbi:MAG: GYD domain-containing protein [Betaproteobacteria bacterium]|nr:GYD domain-containing protein [Betaproteobacteria bacterium]MDH3436839.1 GYD domain-containing protein [Betaproteobacteria bacterium]
MATFISLLNFTDQGIRDVKESPRRYEAFRFMAEKLGVTVESVHYTVGHYDLVVILEGSDEAVTAALLKAGSLGNVRTETLRGFSTEEMKKIVGTMP